MPVDESLLERLLWRIRANTRCGITANFVFCSLAQSLTPGDLEECAGEIDFLVGDVGYDYDHPLFDPLEIDTGNEPFTVCDAGGIGRLRELVEEGAVCFAVVSWCRGTSRVRYPQRIYSHCLVLCALEGGASVIDSYALTRGPQVRPARFDLLERMMRSFDIADWDEFCACAEIPDPLCAIPGGGYLEIEVVNYYHD